MYVNYFKFEIKVIIITLSVDTVSFHEPGGESTKVLANAILFEM